MTPRLKKLLIAAAPLLVLTGIFSLIAPRIFPQVAFVYPSASGEPLKGMGEECRHHEGAIDWQHFRLLYVTGDDSVTLEALSRLPNAPVRGTLKNRASKEDWVEQRKQFRYQSMTKMTESATTKEAVEQTKKLVDNAQLIAQQLQVARALKSIAVKRLKEIDPAELTPKDLVAWVNAACQIERLALGLATEHTKVEVQGSIDLTKLDDRQLQQIAAGEDLQSVLNLN